MRLGEARTDMVDAPARFCILSHWAYGSNKIPFDDVMRLAVALCANVDVLMEG